MTITDQLAAASSAVQPQPPQPTGEVAGYDANTVPAPKILLVGDTGNGKTHALRSLLDAGLQVALIFTEPGMEVVSDIPCSKGMHFHYIPPAKTSWGALSDSATKINQLSFKALANLDDINKREYNGFIDMINSCANFTCDRCKQSFGPVDTLDKNKWAVGFDSLSGISTLAMNLVVGSKPMKSQADWGVAMDNLERFITKITTDIQCAVIVTAHLERETDEVTGGISLMASTLGKKLAPKIPRNFSDVIQCVRNGTKFEWSTATPNVILKARNLPISEHIPPTFVPIINAWRAKAGL